MNRKQYLYTQVNYVLIQTHHEVRTMSFQFEPDDVEESQEEQREEKTKSDETESVEEPDYDFESLIQDLRSERGSVRRAAAQALGELGDVRAREPLIETLRDPSGIVRAAAAESLGQIGNVNDIGIIARLFSDREELVRERVVVALEKIRDPLAVDVFLTALRSSKIEGMRVAAARSLSGFTDKRIFEHLIGALRDKSIFVRKGAITSLVRLGDIRAQEHLIRAMKDKGKGVASSAVQALGEIGDKRAVPHLEKWATKYRKGHYKRFTTSGRARTRREHMEADRKMMGTHFDLAYASIEKIMKRLGLPFVKPVMRFM